MTETTIHQRTALRSRMADVQENLLEMFTELALENSAGWEDVQIEPPEACPARPAPILKQVA